MVHLRRSLAQFGMCKMLMEMQISAVWFGLGHRRVPMDKLYLTTSVTVETAELWCSVKLFSTFLASDISLLFTAHAMWFPHGCREMNFMMWSSDEREVESKLANISSDSWRCCQSTGKRVFTIQGASRSRGVWGSVFNIQHKKITNSLWSSDPAVRMNEKQLQRCEGA